MNCIRFIVAAWWRSFKRAWWWERCCERRELVAEPQSHFPQRLLFVMITFLNARIHYSKSLHIVRGLFYDLKFDCLSLNNHHILSFYVQRFESKSLIVKNSIAIVNCESIEVNVVNLRKKTSKIWTLDCRSLSNLVVNNESNLRNSFALGLDDKTSH